MAFCPSCGAQLADGASCPKCVGNANATGAAVATHTTAGGLEDNVAGALAYVTIIPAIVFLVLEPFNRKRFVRFHAFQCLFFRGSVDRAMDRPFDHCAYSFSRLGHNNRLASHQLSWVHHLACLGA